MVNRLTCRFIHSKKEENLIEGRIWIYPTIPLQIFLEKVTLITTFIHLDHKTTES